MVLGEGPAVDKMPDETAEQAARRRLGKEYPGRYFNHVETRECSGGWEVGRLSFGKRAGLLFLL